MEALKVSSDTYFFEVGERANEHGGKVIQNKAHELGVGEPTGIDLPSEFPGVVPDRKWLAEQNELESKCERAHHGQPLLHRRPNRARRGRSATTWTWRSGRASC